jgi:hypothetical protein
MSSTIKIKRSSTPSSVPTGLSAGELAINLADKRLYSSDGATTFRVGDKELANTNLRIDLVNTNLTGTNTALRTLINDRIQAANVATTYQTKAQARLDLANTNTYIATKVNTSTFNSALANTNTYIATKVNTSTFNSALANTNTYIATKITNAVSTTIQTRNIIPETDVAYDLGSPSRRFRTLYISGSTIALGSANLTSTGAGTLKVGGQTLVANAYLTSTYIANTTARSLILDRYQVANVNSNFFKKTGVIAQTVSPLTTFSANVSIEGKLFVTGGIQTYSANNLSIGDNMIYLNSGSTVSNPDLGFAGNYNDGTYHHAGFFRDASDNGTWKVYENYALEPDANVYINTAHASFRLASFAARNIFAANNLIVSGNTTIAGLKANNSLGTAGYVLKTNGSTVFWSPGNFTQYLQVANASSLFATKAYAAANSYVKSVLANTNSYIASKLDTTTFNSALANTNTYIASKASWTALTGTNTALRTLISDRLQVANASATYATKSNPTTSGLLAHTGRATISTNLAVSGNTSISGAIIANSSPGTAGYYLRTNGTSMYWSPVSVAGSTDQYLQVANAAATYAVKSNPSTSGFFNHTGRLTVGTNLAVSGNTRITGSTIIDGDLTVEGAVTYISSSTLNVDDSMIKLAANNAADTVDVGFYGKYVSAGTKYAGIFRDASDGVFKVYTALQTEPTSTVDTGGTGYTLGTLDAVIDGGTY